MKKRLVKLIMGVALVGISIFYLNAVVVLNDPASPFPRKASIQIGDKITEGASELLQSASEAFLFLNEAELAGANGLNVGEALQRVDMAAARVEQTLNLFKDIIVVGNDAGYDEKRIGRLKGFAYDRFARDNGLSVETMSKVSVYLSRGNVLGFYRHHVRNLQALLKTLNRIKADLLAGKLSENQLLWSLLQQYNNTLMFGNYASLVFYKI